MQPQHPHRAPNATPEPPPVRPVTPGQPYRGTMLPADFILPYEASPDSPMPEYIPEPGPTGILVDARYYTWSFPPLIYRWLAAPRIVVNGRRVPDAAWGTTHVPVPPGVHHVRVGTIPHWIAEWRAIPTSVPAMDFGFADAMIPVRAGHCTTVCYQPPLTTILRGALGPQPREHFPGYRAYRVFAALFSTLMLVLAGLCLYYALFE
ncbi:hypothetical protein [Nocardia sp. X0981]